MERFLRSMTALMILISTSVFSADYELKLAHVTSNQEPLHQALEYYAANVEKRSGGKIKITIHPNGELGTNLEVYEQVKLGLPVIQTADPGYLSDYAPDFGVLNGPYLLEDPKDFKKLLDSSLYQSMKSTVKKNGNFEVLAMNWLFGERHIISNKAILSPSDLKGVSMRVPPNVMWIETVKAMGARATQLAWSEVYTGLSSGVVDAAEAPLGSLYAAKLYESKKHVSLTSHFKAFIGLVINADYFANLPQDIQTILAEEAIKAGDYMTELSIGTTETLLDKLRSEGVTVHKNVDAKAFQKATAPVYGKFPKWSEGLHAKVREILDN
ncbi:C4-dicarboxylate TRAP transporter substrate-binding protein [Vibrio penaeicida]|uniref:C4-dicarboxylate TRAP transporter substrate-binding protein n=1 Tax=Vibrio penaeicida TaxID=104609 RepID=UPI002734B474|nr:C4-dicarboxylate TRAP transporter substrate-binding protein [Vibrio penaeicida]MDP2570963.1 C4-dicarboxylate TRAP transporter substrate-binding protein [Vibrio penaeicida]